MAFFIVFFKQILGLYNTTLKLSNLIVLHFATSAGKFGCHPLTKTNYNQRHLYSLKHD